MAALGPAHYTSSLVFACFLTRSAIYEFRPGFAWRLTRLWHLITRLPDMAASSAPNDPKLSFLPSFLPSCLPVGPGWALLSLAGCLLITGRPRMQWGQRWLTQLPITQCPESEDHLL